MPCGPKAQRRRDAVRPKAQRQRPWAGGPCGSGTRGESREMSPARGGREGGGGHNAGGERARFWGRKSEEDHEWAVRRSAWRRSGIEGARCRAVSNKETQAMRRERRRRSATTREMTRGGRKRRDWRTPRTTCEAQSNADAAKAARGTRKKRRRQTAGRRVGDRRSERAPSGLGVRRRGERKRKNKGRVERWQRRACGPRAARVCATQPGFRRGAGVRRGARGARRAGAAARARPGRPIRRERRAETSGARGRGGEPASWGSPAIPAPPRRERSARVPDPPVASRGKRGGRRSCGWTRGGCAKKKGKKSWMGARRARRGGAVSGRAEAVVD